MSRRGDEMQARVLGVLRHHLGPMSAYDVLDRLRETTPKLAPPTIYRALAALTERGRVHRLESLNAFIACRCDHRHDAAVLSICDGCGVVQESVAPELVADLSAITGQSGFAVKRHVIEVHGTCADCTRQAQV
ncbi:transcriptional repressor [Aestuariibius sp. 2305UL40-4]|uniref:transcriptional repressor n=1 Tax=Aestuariibius violaceus TaxID=3234132 RepID=UPI00347E4885